MLHRGLLECPTSPTTSSHVPSSRMRVCSLFAVNPSCQAVQESRRFTFVKQQNMGTKNSINQQDLGLMPLYDENILSTNGKGVKIILIEAGEQSNNICLYASFHAQFFYQFTKTPWPRNMILTTASRVLYTSIDRSCLHSVISQFFIGNHASIHGKKIQMSPSSTSK